MKIRTTMFSCLLAVALLVFVPGQVFGQTHDITGTVTNATTGEKLPGANVILMGTNYGAATNTDGDYKITAPDGEYTLKCSFVGYGSKTVDVNLTNNTEVNFSLKETEFTLTVNVMADRAKERETPVAFSNIEKKGLDLRLGSRDIPLVLNTTPSVYATPEGGGDGDARINVRGFDQRNVAIMFNGVPVNDMENGWLYWSDWSGVGDATQSVQIQRGLSNVNLAVASIGGTINIITDPTSQNPGVKFKQEIGRGSFLKSTLSAASGLIDNKYAFNAEVVRKTGNGIIDNTWLDAWIYYFGATYNINDKNRIEIYALGGPQQHGQNLYAQNIAAYDASYAKDLGYTDAQLAQYPQSSSGRFYNENWNYVNSSYAGQQYWDGSNHDRHYSNILGERINYYNKPIVNFNYFTQLSNQVSWYTTLYWSGGNGGGSGTYGHMIWDYNSQPSRIVNWNATIANNIAHGDTSQGILRNSVNNQWTLGAISKVHYKLSDNLKTSFGIDWRTASIDHFREVRDLLGGKYFYFSGNQFDSPSNYLKKLGDKIDYYNTNTVNWIGFYGQAEYTKEKLTAYGTLGWSSVKYGYTDHFIKDPKTGGELVLKPNSRPGYQIKGGASYRISKYTDVFANAGYVSLVPIFDEVIDDITGTIVNSPQNQKYTSVEAGINYSHPSGKLAVKGNVYYMIRKNQTNRQTVQNADGSTDDILLTGLNSLHEGVELAAEYRPIHFFSVDVSGSIGNWKYLDDVNGLYKTYNGGVRVEVPYHIYVKDLKVGDAPQTQFSIQASVYPVNNMQAQLVFRHYSNYYANWDALSRTKINDIRQVWKTPAYGVFDAHFAYQLPLNMNNVKVNLYAHIFNIFDTVYIQDATDNSQYNGVSGAPSHSAQRAEVFLGIPRSFNVGASVNF